MKNKKQPIEYTAYKIIEPKVKQETYIITKKYDQKISNKDLAELFNWIKKNCYQNDDTEITITIIKD